MTSKFKVGDRVVLEGVIQRANEHSRYTWLVRLGEGAADDDTWCIDGPHITHAPAHDIGLLPEQLEAVTKERDDAREQLARVCAQLDTARADVLAIRRSYDTVAVELGDMKYAHDLALAGERSADMEVERLRALLDKRSKDARILDCIATLLAMRGEP